MAGAFLPPGGGADGRGAARPMPAGQPADDKASSPLERKRPGRPDPGDALRAYCRTLNDGKPEEAYERYLSSDFKRRRSLDVFLKDIYAPGSRYEPTIGSIQLGEDKATIVGGVTETPKGGSPAPYRGTIEMVWEDGAWKIDVMKLTRVG